MRIGIGDLTATPRGGTMVVVRAIPLGRQLRLGFAAAFSSLFLQNAGGRQKPIQSDPQQHKGHQYRDRNVFKFIFALRTGKTRREEIFPS